MIKLLSPDARSESTLAICLALIAGYVDAYGLIALGVYVSFMSGNTTQTGSLTGQGKVAAALPSAHLRRAGLLASVSAGCLTGAVLSAAAIWYFGVWVLLAPLLILLALALFSSPDWNRAIHSL